MSLVFSTPCRLGFIVTVALLLWGCSGNAPKEPGYEPTPNPSSSSVSERGKPIATGIQMTYRNDASTLNMTLDPYDENLQIEMKRTPRPLEPKETKPAPPPPKKDTVYMMAPPQPTTTVMAAQPTSVNVQLQLPPDRKDTATQVAAKLTSKDAPAPVEAKNDVTDEVLMDIRRAQDYFYKKDYASVLRLVKSAHEKRPTAEGYSLQGSAYYMLGDRDLARYYWGEALKLNPNLPEVIDALSKLDPKPGVP